jgi:HD-GYP domain-containing protein (c-di-GMP phosphodiesterase class II)
MLLEISVPVYRRDKWGRLERDGKIQVSSEVDTLSEGYPALKKELDALLEKVNAETQLAENALALQLEIEEKTRKLNELKQDIALASEHYANFKIFLENLGIDPRLKKLTFDKHLLLSSGPVEDIEALPDPLDYSEF